jgi:urea transporter
LVLTTLVGIIFTSILSVLITTSTAKLLVPKGLTPLTFPFQISTWVWLLSAQVFQHVAVESSLVPKLMLSSVASANMTGEQLLV